MIFGLYPPSLVEISRTYFFLNIFTTTEGTMITSRDEVVIVWVESSIFIVVPATIIINKEVSYRDEVYTYKSETLSWIDYVSMAIDSITNYNSLIEV